MSQIMDELILEEKKTIALRLIMIGKSSLEEIAGITELPIETVKEIASEINS